MSRPFTALCACLAPLIGLLSYPHAAVPQASKKKSPVREAPAPTEEVDDVPRATGKSRPLEKPRHDDEADDETLSDDSKERTPRRRLERPPAEPLRVESVSPELDQVLIDWEQHTAKFKKIAGEFTRFTYYSTFQVEKRAEGTFAYEAPDKGSYVLKPGTVKKGDVSIKKGEDGKPFTIQPDLPERWVCNGSEIIKIDDAKREYDRVEIPPESRGQRMIDGPLPFLFGMKAERAKRRYRLKLLKQTDDEVWLHVVPRTRDDAVNYREATVIIDSRTYLPRAVKLRDPTGSTETVHAFRNVEVNSGKGILSIFARDPFKPNLRGMKLVVHPAGPPAGEGASEATPRQSQGNNKSRRTTSTDRNERDLPRTADAGAAPGKKGTGAKRTE